MTVRLHFLHTCADSEKRARICTRTSTSTSRILTNRMLDVHTPNGVEDLLDHLRTYFESFDEEGQWTISFTLRASAGRGDERLPTVTPAIADRRDEFPIARRRRRSLKCRLLLCIFFILFILFIFQFSHFFIYFFKRIFFFIFYMFFLFFSCFFSFFHFFHFFHFSFFSCFFSFFHFLDFFRFFFSPFFPLFFFFLFSFFCISPFPPSPRPLPLKHRFFMQKS